MANGQTGSILTMIWYDESFDLEACRSCGHFQFLHDYRRNAYKEQTCDLQNDHGCNCGEYVPENNLEYLEYLYDKKQA